MIIIILLSLFVGGLSQGGQDVSRCPGSLQRNNYLKVFGGQCLQFILTERSWPSANTDCRHRGGTLVMIKDAAKQTFIYNTLRSLHWKHNGLWLGASDRDTEGRWIWVDGTRLTYGNWHKGQGATSTSHGFLFHRDFEDCAQMRLDDGGRWHDYPCGGPLYHYSYICEYPLSASAQTTPHPRSTARPKTTTRHHTTARPKVSASHSSARQTTARPKVSASHSPARQTTARPKVSASHSSARQPTARPKVSASHSSARQTTARPKVSASHSSARQTTARPKVSASHSSARQTTARPTTTATSPPTRRQTTQRPKTTARPSSVRTQTHKPRITARPSTARSQTTQKPKTTASPSARPQSRTRLTTNNRKQTTRKPMTSTNVQTKATVKSVRPQYPTNTYVPPTGHHIHAAKRGSQKSSNGSNETGIIVGLTIGGAVLVAVVIVVGIFIRRKRIAESQNATMSVDNKVYGLMNENETVS